MISDATTTATTAATDSPWRSAWRKDGQANRAFAALQELKRKLDAQDPATVKQAAAQMASTLFFQPLLEEMRKLEIGKNFAHGGRGEDVFGDQLDLRVADAVAASNPGGITAKIAEKIQRRRHEPEQTATDVADVADETKRSHRDDSLAGVPQASWTTLIKAQLGNALPGARQ